MSVLRVGVALVMGAMLLAVAAAKARQDGRRTVDRRKSESRQMASPPQARQDGPKKVALLKPAFGLTAAPELITTRIGQIKLKRVPAGEFMMSSNSSVLVTMRSFSTTRRARQGKRSTACGSRAPSTWAYTK